MLFGKIWIHFFSFGMKDVISGANDQPIFTNPFPRTSLLWSKRSNPSGNSPNINTRFCHHNYLGRLIWIGIFWGWKVAMPKWDNIKALSSTVAILAVAEQNIHCYSYKIGCCLWDNQTLLSAVIVAFDLQKSSSQACTATADL